MTPSILVLPLTLLLVTGPYSLSVGELKDQVLPRSRAHFAEAGIKLKVNHIYKMRDKHRDLETISESRMKFEIYRDFARRFRGKRTGRIHIELPPMIEGPIRYIGGFAEGGCRPLGVSVSNGAPIRSNGGEAFTMSSIAFSHETAHTANAVHNEKVPNIMHPAALQYSGQPIGFLSSTIYRMRRCLK